MAKGTQYSKQFKEDAVRYRKDHPELTVQKAAENLGISESALKNWMKAARENEGSVPTRGTLFRRRTPSHAISTAARRKPMLAVIYCIYPAGHATSATARMKPITITLILFIRPPSRRHGRRYPLMIPVVGSARHLQTR